MNKENYKRIFAIGEKIGSAQEIMRFVTDDERDSWFTAQKKIIVDALAPVGDEPFDENLQGDKIALQNVEIYTFEMARLESVRYIVGDYETLEDYNEHLRAELNEYFDSIQFED